MGVLTALVRRWRAGSLRVAAGLCLLAALTPDTAAAPRSVPILAEGRSQNTLTFDARALKRFGIDRPKFQADASVINREARLWTAPDRTLLFVGAVLIAQFLLIGGLLVQHRRRRRVERILHDLSGRLLSAQEEERRRIARELHDNVSQQIAMLAVRIDQIGMSPGGHPEVLARAIRDLHHRAVDISSEIHNLSHRLHSSKLEMLGLGAALRGHCEELLAHGVHARFHDEGLPPLLPKDVELCLFRIVQEALNNVVKHSGAREAEVTIRRERKVLILTVADRGRGFNPASGSLPRGLGLASMRERLRLIDGALAVRTEPGQGTTITARVPISRAGSVPPEMAGVA